MRQRLVFLAILVLVTAGGCGGGDQPPPAEPAPAPSPAPAPAPDLLSYDESVAMCVEMHQEAAKCPAEFVAVVFELRARYVPEFAAAIADPATRAELERAGIEETKIDGGPASQEKCAEYAQPSWGPPSPRRDAAAAKECYQQERCADRMSCLGPIIEPRFKARAEAAAE